MSTVALGLRIVATVRAGGVLLAHRPSSRIVHLARTRPTRSGRYVPRSARTLCGCRTGRLTVVDGDVTTVPAIGCRFCRRCTATLPPAREQLRTRDDDETLFGHLTVADFMVAARWCLTVDETHQVGRIVTVVHGPAPARRPTEPGPRSDRWLLEQAILGRRDTLRLAEMSPEERDLLDLRRTGRQVHLAAEAAAYRQEHAVARAQDRARRGQYLLPYQRKLLDRTETRRP